MPKVSITVPHELGQAEAARRVTGLMDAIARKYADQIKITEQNFGETSGTFAFKTMGMTVSGQAAIEPASVSIDCDLPFAAVMFKGRIEKEIRDTLEKILKG
jgi:hypothetical protein